MSDGFIKLRRAEATWELLKDRNAFVLLTVIALRARRTDGFSRHGLKTGQALIGDHEAYGLSKQQYRSAKRRLRRYGLADFKATPRGTIATLLEQRIYDINVAELKGSGTLAAAAHQPGTSDGTCPRARAGVSGREKVPDPFNSTQPAPWQHTANTQPTTNKNGKKEKNEKRSSCNAEALRLSELLLESIVRRKADLRRPNLQRWVREMDRLIVRDGRTPERIEAVIAFCQRDPFWQNNILCPATLRRQFDRLELLMQQRRPAESTAEIVARLEREGRLE